MRYCVLVLFLMVFACGDDQPDVTSPAATEGTETANDDGASDDVDERRRDRPGVESDPAPDVDPGSDPEPDPDPNPDPDPDPDPDPGPQTTPSNASEFGGFEVTGIASGPPNGTFDTDAQCTSDSVMGDCRAIAGDPLTPDVCVCRSDELTINDLQVVGTRALVVLASKTLHVTGTLDVSAIGAEPGPGSFVMTSMATQRMGGVGGSFGAQGGGLSEVPYGTDDLQPLLGGLAGQDTCGIAESGGGGGALQLSAGESITVTGTILANGGGGAGGVSGDLCNGGAGGGSGGAVLIEAPRVEVTGIITANGGGGGSGGTTDFIGYGGEDGSAGIEPAPGGSSVADSPCLLYWNVYSGNGGAGGTSTTDATSGGVGGYETRCLGDTYSGDGGGGDSVGRIRINTTRGAQNCLCNGTMSPSPTFGDI